MHTIDTKFWLILSRSKNFVVFLNWNQHCWDRWHVKIRVAVVLAIEICVELVFIREMTLPIPIIPIPSDRQIMAVPIFRSPFSRQLRGARREEAWRWSIQSEAVLPLLLKFRKFQEFFSRIEKAHFENYKISGIGSMTSIRHNWYRRLEHFVEFQDILWNSRNFHSRSLFQDI